MIKRILITGASGFVGKNLLEYLRDRGEYHITGVSRNVERLNGLSDLLDEGISYDQLFESKLSYNHVVHLAGQVIKKEEDQSSDSLYREANYDLTCKMYDYFLKDEYSEKFVFLSSIHVLTEIPDQIIDESYPPMPFTPYGRSKYEAEKYIVANESTTKKAYILRPTMIHGPGNRGNLKSLYNYIISGLPYLFGAANNSRSFLSIDNLCFILKEILDNEIKEGLYHIADDEPTKTHNLIDKISKMSGVKSRIYDIPLLLLRAFARLGNYLPIPFDSHRYGKLTSDFVVKNDKIKQAIGKPLPVTADEGMNKTIESFLEAKN